MFDLMIDLKAGKVINNGKETSWENLFTQAEKEGKEAFKKVDRKELTYKYYGELDSPYDCISKGIPEEIVNRQFHGKCHVFSVSDGTYIFCNDFQAESIFDSGKVERASYFYFECDDNWSDED